MDLKTADGVTLSAQLYPAQQANGAVLIAPAMGVPQRFYQPLAEWLVTQGISTLTFDYRGMGQSLHGPLKQVQADILTWARYDLTAAVGALPPELPLTLLGHSLGGQIVPFAGNRQRLSKIVTVASGSGYWRHNAPALRRKVWLMWYGLVPLLTPVFGYFPGEKLGVVGNLPADVVLQWRRWCLHREYVVGVEPEARALFAEVTTPLTALSFTDDEMMSAENIRSLHSFYTNAPIEMRRYSPSDVGETRVGHFGFFKAKALWPKLLLPEVVRHTATTARA